MDSAVQTFKKNLHKKNRGLKQTSTDKCDVILYFFPIASRAGTDIDGALNRLDNLQVSKPVILVVFHPTFDPEKVILDTKVVNRDQTLAVDCLFYEDTGLLQCQKNKDAVDTITGYLKSKNLTSYACYHNGATPYSSSDCDADDERSPLIPSTEDSRCHNCLKCWKCWDSIIVIFLLLLVLLGFILLFTFKII